MHGVAYNLSNDHSECISAPDIDDPLSLEERNEHRHHLLSPVAEAQTAKAAIAPAVKLLETIECHHVVSAEGQVSDLLLLEERVRRGALLVVVRSGPLVGTFAPDVECATLHGDPRLLLAAGHTDNVLVVKHVLNLIRCLLVRRCTQLLNIAKPESLKRTLAPGVHVA